MRKFSYLNRDNCFFSYINLHFTLNNEKIKNQVQDLVSNFSEYKYHEWRVVCHDMRGGVFNMPFSFDDSDEFVYEETYPSYDSTEFDYAKATLEFILNIPYLRRYPLGEKDYLYLNTIHVDVRSIEITEDEVILSEWVNG